MCSCATTHKLNPQGKGPLRYVFHAHMHTSRGILKICYLFFTNVHSTIINKTIWLFTQLCHAMI